MFLLKTYRIETERIVARCYEPSDAKAMSEGILRNVEHLAPWLPWAATQNHDLETVSERIRLFRGNYDIGRDHTMGIWDRQDGSYIGGTGFHLRVGENAYEIGYWIDHRRLRQGLATHVAAALTKVAFVYEGVHRMNIHMHTANLPSKLIPARLGYQLEGRLLQRVPLQSGGYSDIFCYAMLREHFDASDFRDMAVKAFGFDGRPLELLETELPNLKRSE